MSRQAEMALPAGADPFRAMQGGASVDGRRGKAPGRRTPVLHDLRMSGAIEQDADNVLFVYRPEYYLGDQPPERRMGEAREAHANCCSEWERRRREVAGVAEVIVAKNREGESNKTVRLRWDRTLMRFHEPREGARADVDGRETV